MGLFGGILDKVVDVGMTLASSGALGPMGMIGAAAFNALKDGKLTASDLGGALTAAGVPAPIAQQASSLAQAAIEGKLDENAFVQRLAGIASGEMQKVVQNAITGLLGNIGVPSAPTTTASSSTSTGPLV